MLQTFLFISLCILTLLAFYVRHQDLKIVRLKNELNDISQRNGDVKISAESFSYEVWSQNIEDKYITTEYFKEFKKEATKHLKATIKLDGKEFVEENIRFNTYPIMNEANKKQMVASIRILNKK